MDAPQLSDCQYAAWDPLGLLLELPSIAVALRCFREGQTSNPSAPAANAGTQSDLQHNSNVHVTRFHG